MTFGQSTVSQSPLFNMLQPETQRRVIVIESMLPASMKDIAGALGVSQEELIVAISRGTGDAGRVFELIVTGKNGDNLCEADDGDVDVKLLGVVPAPNKVTARTVVCPWNPAWKPKEISGIRITRMHLQNIQHTPFSNCGAFKKSIMLLGSYEHLKGCDILDYRLVNLVFIDLRPYHAQAKLDYDYYAEECRWGRAHLFSSEKSQPGKILKLYSHSHHQPYQATKLNGKLCYPKKRKDGTWAGYSFYLFRDQIVDLTK